MPPHCDSMDGPVVTTAARKALEARDAELVLPYVPKGGEDQIRETFDAVLGVRDQVPRNASSPTCTSSRPLSGCTAPARAPSGADPQFIECTTTQ